MFPVRYFLFPITHSQLGHTHNQYPAQICLVASMNINCYFAGHIGMTPSLKSFKRAANLCDTDHHISNHLGALTCQPPFWPLGFHRQAGQLQITAHLHAHPSRAK